MCPPKHDSKMKDCPNRLRTPVRPIVCFPFSRTGPPCLPHLGYHPQLLEAWQPYGLRETLLTLVLGSTFHKQPIPSLESSLAWGYHCRTPAGGVEFHQHGVPSGGRHEIVFAFLHRPSHLPLQHRVVEDIGLEPRPTWRRWPSVRSKKGGSTGQSKMQPKKRGSTASTLMFHIKA